jgi:outer membrane lipoprotein SlyB
LPAPVENNTASLPQGSGSESWTINSESGDEAKATQKEGISKAAKGAVIGGIAGAGAGAVINKKNRVVGAVVGAVIGAGGGYVLGRKMDKKDGRY